MKKDDMEQLEQFLAAVEKWKRGVPLTTYDIRTVEHFENPFIFRRSASYYVGGNLAPEPFTLSTKPFLCDLGAVTAEKIQKLTVFLEAFDILFASDFTEFVDQQGGSFTPYEEGGFV